MITTKQGSHDLQAISSCYMLGVLAMDEERYPGLGEDQEAVTFLRNTNTLLFYIKPICSDPEPIAELEAMFPTEFYIGFDRSLESIKRSNLPPDFDYMKPYQKPEVLKKALQGKIILFQPALRYDTASKPHKNLSIISLEDDIEWKPGERYIPISTLQYLTPDEFEDALFSQETIELACHNHYMETPDYIICGEFLYSFVESNWKKHPSKRNAWIQANPSFIKKIQLGNDVQLRDKIAVNEHLLFLDSEQVFRLKKKIEEDGFLLVPKEMKEDKTELSREERDVNSSNPLETRFLKNLEAQALAKNLYYDFNDLVNFHVSVKTNPLTILAGMSGVGKTQLPLIYAEALGLTEESGNKNLLILPISPAYTEPGDILGYLNTTNGLYIPSETGLVDFLVEASRNSKKMYMVLFEEMNLSQVEHWFAPFISLLELKEGQRKLSLYSPKTICHNIDKYPPSIMIKDNVLFIGTVNLDETTKDFSDRLLDRANVVVLKKMSFVEQQEKVSSFNQSSEIELVDDEQYKAYYPEKESYESWLSSKKPSEAFENSELVFFDELHRKIHEVDHNKGVSFRILERMGLYLNNIPLNAEGKMILSRQEAIDIQVKQRILTKIRGSREQYEQLIGVLYDPFEELTSSELYNFFTSEEAKKISDFKMTLGEIRRKARELFLNDYTT